MEHLHHRSKCSLFHNISIYIVFQRRQRGYHGVKGSASSQDVGTYRMHVLAAKAQTSLRKTPVSPEHSPVSDPVGVCLNPPPFFLIFHENEIIWSQ